MKNYARENIYKILESGKKRQLTFNASENLIEAMDQISKEFEKINDQTYPRNALLQDAIMSYINEIDSVLKEEYNVDIFKEKVLEEEPDPYHQRENMDFDMVIYPGYSDGFYSAFLNEKRWYYVRIQKEKIEHLKYIAIYLGKPVSGITHYAKISKYVPSDRFPGKYIVWLEEDSIVQLPEKIKLGNTSPAATRAPKYTTFKRFQRASTFQDL